MKEKTPRLYASHILRELDFLEEVAATHDFRTFADSAYAVRAVTYSVQIISEATRHLPPEWLAEVTSINWKAIKGIGNVTRHDYPGVMTRILWEIATVERTKLRPVIQSFHDKSEP